MCTDMNFLKINHRLLNSGSFPKRGVVSASGVENKSLTSCAPLTVCQENNTSQNNETSSPLGSANKKFHIIWVLG